MPSVLVGRMLTPDKRYQRCLGFGCCHIRTCVFVVGILELLALATAVVTLFVLYELTAESFLDRNLSHGHHHKSSVAKADSPDGLLSTSYVTGAISQPQHISDTLSLDQLHPNITSTPKSTRRQQQKSADSSSESSEEQDDDSGKGGKSSDSNEDDSSSEEEIEKEKDLIYLRAKHRYYVRSMAVAAAAFVAGVFVVALMFTGLVKRRSRFLLPHLGVQLLAMIGLVVVIILYSVWCASGGESNESKRHLYPINQSISCWLIIASCTTALTLEIFSFWSVLSCYRYLSTQTITEHDSDAHRFLPLRSEKYDDATKWTHRCATAPGALVVPGNRV